MGNYRILIVDDQHEVRRVLKSAVQSLGPEYQVVDTPSAEEALLIYLMDQIDLLISDIRLPGISGFELIEKIQRRNPEAKVILITGLEDSGTRQQVSQSGASAAFFKPIAITEFLTAVQDALGIGPDGRSQDRLAEPSSPDSSQEVSPLEVSTAMLLGKLASLQASAGATTAALVDGNGSVVEYTGKLPPDFSTLTLPLAQWITSGSRLSSMLSAPQPETVFHLNTPSYNLLLSHVQPDLALMLAAPSPHKLQELTAVKIVEAAAEVRQILAARENQVQLDGSVVPAVGAGEPSAPIEAVVEISAEELKDVEALFHQDAAEALGGVDLNTYWETVVEQSEQDENLSSGALSYEEARKMGLAPEER